LADADAAGRYLTRRTRPNVPVPEKAVRLINGTTERVRTQGASEFKVLEPKGTVNVFLFVVKKFDWWFSRFGKVKGQHVVTVHILIRSRLQKRMGR
jgi:hypothetical protein